MSILVSVATQKKLKTQDWAIKNPKKTQAQISIRFRKISGKNRSFPEKSKLFLKKCLYPPKFSDDLFFVIASDFQIFHPDLSTFYHFSPKMSYFLQKTT